MWQLFLPTFIQQTKPSGARTLNKCFLQFMGSKFKVGGAVLLWRCFYGYPCNCFSLCTQGNSMGRHVYAVGDDPEAELSGVNVKRTLITVYATAGLICGFAGWALIANSSVSPTSGQLLNIESITAVVIGGISFEDEAYSWNVFCALIVGVFTLGLRLAGADAQWTYLLIGGYHRRCCSRLMD